MPDVTELRSAALHALAVLDEFPKGTLTRLEDERLALAALNICNEIAATQSDSA